jgi:hypothetical protein
LKFVHRNSVRSELMHPHSLSVGSKRSPSAVPARVDNSITRRHGAGAHLLRRAEQLEGRCHGRPPHQRWQQLPSSDCSRLSRGRGRSSWRGRGSSCYCRRNLLLLRLTSVGRGRGCCWRRRFALRLCRHCRRCGGGGGRRGGGLRGGGTSPVALVRTLNPAADRLPYQSVPPPPFPFPLPTSSGSARSVCSPRSKSRSDPNSSSSSPSAAAAAAASVPSRMSSKSPYSPSLRRTRILMP